MTDSPTHCDRCGAALPPGDVRYLVTVTITADWDEHLPAEATSEPDTGAALDRALAQAAAASQEDLEAGVVEHRAFIVCPACRRMYRAQTFGRGAAGAARDTTVH